MRTHQLSALDTLNQPNYSQGKLDSLSYALGVNISETFKMQGVDGLNGSILARGFADFSANTTSIDGAKALNILQSFMQKQQAIAAEKNKANFAEVIAEGEQFLAENGKRPEVTTLPSGLQYEIIKEGNGEKPTMMNSVLAHYHGTLINGTVFDSSVDRGEPTEFPVSGVISGWTEALQLMPVGSKWKLYVPYNLAYGERGAGAQIGPYSTLIFDVELLEITK
ncbi:MAG: FKBP-type peptidyl-prolyl cis-trans isomerase [Flavobacteriales bacterium]|nr:FKBP-type peptidyl-prolyl cis-trans isomerase [Flavobacteriales bacterium]